MTGTIATIETNTPTTLWGLTLSGLSHFTLELCHNFLPVIYPLLIVDMALSYQQIGYVALLVGLATSLPQPFMGFLTDRFGAYRISGLSILWLGLLVSMIGLVPNYPLFALLVSTASLGSAAYHPAGVVLATVNSRSRRGRGMSIFSVGGNIGAALSPLLVAALLPWFGLKATAVVLPFALVVGLLLYWQGGILLGKRQDNRSTHPPADTTFLWGGLALLILAAMTRSWFQVSLLTYLPVWVQSEGGTLAQASWLLSLLAFSIGVGSMIGGLLADRVGAWIIVLSSFLLTAPAYWLFLSTFGLLQYISVVLIGICIGATYPTFLLMAQDCWPARTGTASGLIMGIGWAPGGLGASFTGYIADTVSLSYGLYLLLVPALVGLMFMLLWRGTMQKKMPYKKIGY